MGCPEKYGALAPHTASAGTPFCLFSGKTIMQPSVNQRRCAEHPALERLTVTVTRGWGWARALTAGIQMDTEKWRRRGGGVPREASCRRRSPTPGSGVFRRRVQLQVPALHSGSRVGSYRGEAPRAAEHSRETRCEGEN